MTLSEPVMVVEHVTNDNYPTFTVRVWTPPDVWAQQDGRPGWVRFEVFAVAGVNSDDTPVYETPGSSSPLDHPTEVLDEAVRCAWGDVKWDGCVNYEITTNDNVMLHACSSEDLGLFLDAIQRGYDLAYSFTGDA